MNAFLNGFIRTIFKIILNLMSKIKQLWIFTIPNISKIKNGKILFSGSYPYCDQFTQITGLGSIEIGDNCSFGYKLGGFNKGGMVELQPRYRNSKIKLGNNVSTNNNVFICAANYIEIGDDTLIGQYVTMMDHEAHGINPLKRRELGEIGKIITGRNVWIGNNVIILKNSEIGDNSIIAAGSVVTGKFPSNVVIAGIPAKVTKTI
jgi:acetyltransferase-like isoleucine patch superfamily enzyme